MYITEPTAGDTQLGDTLLPRKRKLLKEQAAKPRGKHNTLAADDIAATGTTDVHAQPKKLKKK